MNGRGHGYGGGDWKEWSQHVLIEIQRLNAGQNDLSSKQNTMNNTLIKNTDQLEIHIKRSNSIELALEEYRKEMESRITPLEQSHTQSGAYWKVLTLIACAPPGVYAVAKLVIALLNK